MSVSFRKQGSAAERLSPANDFPFAYRPAIDGLRAIAVLAVFVFHLNRQWLPGGFVGVDIFFVVSGYLITSVLLRDFDAGNFSLWNFYQRRIARLLPAALTVSLTTLLAAFFIYSAQDLASCGANLVSGILSVANFKYMFQGNYFRIQPDAQPFLHYWSLSVEEQFYLLFPALLVMVYVKARRNLIFILAALCAFSLTACIALTYREPNWAFYLLPTRAWELLAGSIVSSVRLDRLSRIIPRTVLCWSGLALILASLFLIGEGPMFPGYLAIPPVLGTVMFLGGAGASGSWPERMLSSRAMVFVGRMSYSLYLWHWPVFCFVDYHFYLLTPLVRTGIKVALSMAVSAACFRLIENPARSYFNHPRRRILAFAFACAVLVICVPLGMIVRKTFYIDAGRNNIAAGGIVFPQSNPKGSVVLMGDSNGSMYGRVIKRLASNLHLNLSVISVASGDPLPASSGASSQLWLDSVTLCRQQRPDMIILACDWKRQLSGDPGRLDKAIEELRACSGRLILIAQPPELPVAAERLSMRNGTRPPFFEDPVIRVARMNLNNRLNRYQNANLTVVETDSIFTAVDGSILFTDQTGVLFYHDRSHLSDTGAQMVEGELARVMLSK